ncbi:hypothetical protein EPR50_G00210780 [Perca flavescens]|uniref:CTNNB1 binding N-teminal domain-containing protein n=1 Tax=Perca flavescens TaxID=8167 RepID=A0A484C1K9_PERFV|nr:hypothetical protein EPR50_G00210780 [Perca flavescens]
MIHSTSFDFCLMFIFFCFNTAAAPEPGPPLFSLPSNPDFPTPALSFKNFLHSPRLLPSSCFLPSSVLSWGSSLCCLCVGVCVRVCVPCVFSVCVGVKASLCMLAGIGSNPGVPFTHLWNQQSGFQAPFSIHQTQPLPHSAYPHSKSCTAPYSPTLTLQGKHGFHTAKKEQGCKLSSPLPPSL